MRHVGRKLFQRINGVWIDNTFTAKHKTTTVTYLSDEYFDLLKKHPELKSSFALGEAVVIVLDDKTAIIVQPEDK